MTFNHWKNVLSLVILCGFSQSLSASATTKLIIKPSVCMVKEQGDTCQMNVNVTWHSEQLINACLFQNDLRLTCWQDVSNINTKMSIHLDQDMQFTLKNDQQVFAVQHIKINTALPTKYRRRLRANWSFF